MEHLIKLSVGLALAALVLHRTPQIINSLRMGQIILIQESKASRSPKALTLEA